MGRRRRTAAAGSTFAVGLALAASLTVALSVARAEPSQPPIAAQAPSPAPGTAPAAALAPAAPAPSAPIAAPPREAADAEDKANASVSHPPDEARLRAMVRAEATSVGMPPELAEAVAKVESAYNPRAVGGVGEIGLMQVLPSTARMLGFAGPLPGLFDPETNIRYGVRYLGAAWRMTGEDICSTVMKYRAGHGETRFSHKSVAYCLRVRAELKKRGYKVTGEVPVATFGAPAGSAGPAMPRGARRLANGRIRMRFNWTAVDLRRRALDKVGRASVSIMQ